MHSICLSVSVFSVVFHVSLLFYKNLVQFVTLTELIDSIQGYSKRMECIHYYQMQLLQVFLSNKIEKCLYIWYVYLFLCLQSSKSCKYPSIVLKLIYVVQVYNRMFRIENGIGILVCVQKYTKESRYITVNWQNLLKCILMCLCCTKCNEINISYSDVQKYICYKNGVNNFDFSYTGSNKQIYI